MTTSTGSGQTGPIQPQGPGTPSVFKRGDIDQMSPGGTLAGSVIPAIAATGINSEQWLVRLDSIFLSILGMAKEWRAMQEMQGRSPQQAQLDNPPAEPPGNIELSPQAPERIYGALLEFLGKIPNPETYTLVQVQELLTNNKTMVVGQIRQALSA